jgi:hypothetical protein
VDVCVLFKLRHFLVSQATERINDKLVCKKLVVTYTRYDTDTCLEQASFILDVVRVTSAKFGLRAGNMKFTTQNEE